MNRTSRVRRGTVTAAATALALVVTPAVTALVATLVAAEPSRGPGAPVRDADWVASWVSMPQLTEPNNLPPAPFTGADAVLVDTTLRQTVHTSIGGPRLRLRFSNAFGGAALPITKVSVALPAGGVAGVSAVQPGTSRAVTFSGRASVVVPVGAQVVSDPLPFAVRPSSNLTVTTYLADGQQTTDLTSHPGSRTTSYLLRGDHTTDQDLPGAASTAHWYLLSALEVVPSRPSRAVVMLGDSLTDGRGSTTDGNDRWPDQLLARLQARRDTADVAVLNQAAGGNRVLNDGLGPNVLARLDRDVLATSGVSWTLVFHGINDLGAAEPTAAAQDRVVADLIAGYEQIVTRAHAQGITVYGATLLPIGGNDGYDDPSGLRRASVERVNAWIRTSRVFDGVVDFGAAVADPADPSRLDRRYDVGDHLHLNPAGYGALAAAVPLRWFR